eukprot:CAMPEP_0184481760 /NCGR_PEP_ID=MMETSP0113_2-20130426/3327_1 /TAXON_ID=91329 /ORGANISM="Norrisiella sphaerica, Strain BC52" /LENGTH=653 /DNA_ID=CAMNT_0026861095 /DNA_START=186 /DNA_END=2147 /DNA_ORIENTATION=-
MRPAVFKGTWRERKLRTLQGERKRRSKMAVLMTKNRNGMRGLRASSAIMRSTPQTFRTCARTLSQRSPVGIHASKVGIHTHVAAKEANEGKRRSQSYQNPTKTTNSIDFEDGEVVYSKHSTWELIRAYVIFQFCGLEWIVKNSDRMLHFALRVFGASFVQFLLRPTLFAQFCGGESLTTIQPFVRRLKEARIGGILDYAAEADVGDEVGGQGGGINEADASSNVRNDGDEEEIQGKQNNLTSVSVVTSGKNVPVTTRSGHALARQYSYQTEMQCDANAKIFETSIRAVHGVSPDGFAAVKVTALGNPLLLERCSDALRETQRLFRRMDLNDDGMITLEEFASFWSQWFVEADAATIQREFNTFDSKNTGVIDPIAWTTTLDPEMMRTMASKCKDESPFSKVVLNPEEQHLLDSMESRFDKLVKLADELDVRLMVDAEHTYFQPAIDNIVLKAQQRHNKHTDRVYQTIQCYLKDSRSRNALFMKRAETEGWKYAVKIVRGAYMHQERARAKKRNEPDPIHDTIEDTHKCFADVMEDVITRPKVTAGQEKVNMVIATHNQLSVQHAIGLLEKAKLTPQDSGIAFGQLLGMADHLTYTLGANGFCAYKYIPYGPMLECLPYLLRRAQENSDLMGSVGCELSMLSKEIRRRLLGRIR